jgi:hypothetical protein
MIIIPPVIVGKGETEVPYTTEKSRLAKAQKHGHFIRKNHGYIKNPYSYSVANH